MLEHDENSGVKVRGVLTPGDMLLHTFHLKIIIDYPLTICVLNLFKDGSWF